MNHFTHLLPESLVTALGWTLLHSLWQGAGVALLAGVALILLRKHSATVRYFVTLTALATVFLLAVVTFTGCYSTSTTGSIHAYHRAGPAQVLLEAQPPATTGLSTIADAAVAGFTGYFTEHFPLLVLGWAAGVLVLLLRLVGGLSYVARLTNYQVAVAGNPWQQTVAHLGQKMGLRTAVTLLESGLAKVPMTVGYLKPVILLPVGAIAGLSPAQVEAVLAHELAHIRRHDYLVNLAQSLLEILMFYHPAVWWLAARVREEREHCCDDLAIASCSDSVTFARALVHLEERYGQAAAAALAVNGPDGVLLGRIKRLLAQPRRTSTFVEGFIAALVLLAGAAVVSVSASTKLNENSPGETIRTAPVAAGNQKSFGEQVAAERTAFHLEWTDSTDRRSDVIIVKDKKGNIIELYVDGRRIPEKELKNYRERIDQALAEQKRNRYSDAPSRDVNAALRRIETNGGNWYMPGDLAAVPPPPVPPAPYVAPVPAVPPVPPSAPVPSFDDWEGMRQGLDGKLRETMENLRETNQNLQELMHDLDSDFRRQHHGLLEELRRVQEEREGNSNNQAEKELEKLNKERLNLEGKLEKLGFAHAESRAALEKQMLKAQAEANQKQAELQRLLQKHQEMQQTHARHNAEMLTQAEAEGKAAMREHEKQMKEHREQMKIHEAQMKKHQAFQKALNDQLEKDGFLKGNGDIEFRMENGQLFINEQLQPDEVYGKYQKLFEEHGQTPRQFHWKRDN